MRESFPQAPVALEVSNGRYVRLDDHFALHGGAPSALCPELRLRLGDRALTVCRGRPPQRGALPAGVGVGPVYALEPAGSLAVPTGRLLVRFGAGVEARSRRRSLEAAGYSVHRLLSYAPHAVWVQARSRDVASALGGIARLERLPDVVNVEPQMLMEGVSRN